VDERIRHEPNTTGDIECCFFSCMIACFVAQRELIGQVKIDGPGGISSNFQPPRILRSTAWLRSGCPLKIDNSATAPVLSTTTWSLTTPEIRVFAELRRILQGFGMPPDAAKGGYRIDGCNRLLALALLARRLKFIAGNPAANVGSTRLRAQHEADLAITASPVKSMSGLYFITRL